MYKLSRFCKECQKEIFYSCKDAYNLAEKNKAKCRSCATSKYAKRIGDCSFLLKKEPESLYWLGFILADGHFDNSKRLTITLAKKDKDHLLKLAIKIGCNLITVKGDQPSLSIMQTKIIPILCHNYKIYSNKTENPPDLSSLSKEELLNLSIGFIDGDGCIKYQYKRNDILLTIKCHKSWLNNLILMFGKAYINKEGYAISNIGKHQALKELKIFALSNNLPILERKWNKIKI